MGNLEKAIKQDGEKVPEPPSNLEKAIKQDGEQATKQDGELFLTFQTHNMHHQTLSFTEVPLGLTFNDEFPLQISSATDDAKKKGVQVGWKVLSINDQDVAHADMTYDECFRLLKTEMEKLPLVDKVVMAGFATGTGNVGYALFTQKPIGMTLEGFPLKVESCSPDGQAAQKSVKPGLTLLSVNGQDLTKSPIDNHEDAMKAFQKAISNLPEVLEMSPVVGA